MGNVRRAGLPEGLLWLVVVAAVADGFTTERRDVGNPAT
jgi:hypothetical protein